MSVRGKFHNEPLWRSTTHDHHEDNGQERLLRDQALGVVLKAYHAGVTSE